MSIPLLFDRTTIWRRRSTSCYNMPNFLSSPYVEILAQRLLFTSRRFTTVLIIGLDPKFYPLLFKSYQKKPFIYSLLFKKDRKGENLCVLGDDEILPFKNHSFDLIISFFHLHLVNDLPGVLSQLKNCLQPDGLLLAAFAGGDTLGELRACFEEAELELKGGVHPRIAPTVQLKEAGALLQRAGFALPVVDDDRVQILYKHPLEIMKDLKKGGQSNAMVQRSLTITPKSIFLKMAEIYKEKYEKEGFIPVTLNTLFLSGWAPCPTQPKALKRGSAHLSLEAVLKKI